MEGIHSFKQRSSSDWDGSRGNRVVLANRRDPELGWRMTNDSDSYLCACFRLRKCLTSPLSCWFHCKLFGGAEPAKSFSRARVRRRMSDVPSTMSDSDQNLNSIEQTLSPSFDFGPFPSNKWTTSKYTLINFLPKNLFEQFRRLANFYFLITATLQIVLPFSPVGPSTSLIPLLFVISTTAIKQAYEDYLRHKLDNQLNERPCYVLKEDKTLVKICSKDIKVGDIVYVKNNEEIPCDMILLASSGSGDRCYITTSNLDGESSLKSRTCFQVRQQIGDIDRINESLLLVECEKPNATLYEFNGFLRAPRDAKGYESLMRGVKFLDELKTKQQMTDQASVQSGERQPSAAQGQQHIKRLSVIGTIFRRIKQAHVQTKIARNLASEQLRGKSVDAERLIDSISEHIEISLDISNLLLRASRLRNTNHIYGLAVYTGEDTKLARNSQVKPNKFSSLESRVNMYLGIAFIILILLTLISSISYQDPNKMTTLGDKPRRPQSAVETFAGQFMLYNYLVPISLYVTLEFVKFLSTITVLEDKKLQAHVWSYNSNLKTKDEYNSNTNGAADRANDNLAKIKHVFGPQCNSSDLNEDLGQVEVLFSDKTGTLTENKMIFKACSVQGRLFRVLSNQFYEQPEGLCSLPALNVAKKLTKIKGNRYAAIASELSEQHGPRSAPRSLNAASRSSKSSLDRLAKLPPHQRPFDHRLFPDVKELKLVENLERNQQLAEFFFYLCLCSTISINEQTPIDECLRNGLLEQNDYQTASPDEESLISAAALAGVIICKSNERECTLAIRRGRRIGSPLAEEASKRQQKSNTGGKKTSSPSERSSRQKESPSPADTRFKALTETPLSNDNYIVRRFERLITFEFNSTRKKMSVLYRDCDIDCLLLVTKGSESVLDCIALGDQMSPASERNIDMIMAHFEAFSKSGLRTMLVARRFLELPEYEKIVADMRAAKLMSTQEGRNERLASLYKQVECNMMLVGATAVEDSLQMGVPETIADLRGAGIKVWLLTGDKVETAISVAYLCKLLDRNMNILMLIRQQDPKACKELLRSYVERVKRALLFGDEDENEVEVTSASHRESVSKRPKSHMIKQQGSPLEREVAKLMAPLQRSTTCPSPNESDLPRFALVADGRSLHYAMKHAKQELEFICNCCASVLGCRLSPLQKAEIVDMIKNGENEPITAAIGDGANDVSMIQEAHVGIGISGKEGRQAVNSSDFAVNRFHMLNRLFFVHGHLFYHRTANTIHYFFYKSFLFIIPQFIYSFYNRNSPTSLYHPTMLISYNMIFTSIPILLYGLSEVSFPEALLESRPRLYRVNRRNEKMRYPVFFSWLLLGSLQALIAFYSTHLIWASHTPYLEPDNSSGLLGFSLTLFFSIVVLAVLRLFIVSRQRSWFFDMASALSCCVLPATFYLLNLVDLGSLFKNNALQGHVVDHLGAPLFWFTTIGATSAAIIPDILIYIRSQIKYHRTINDVIDAY